MTTHSIKQISEDDDVYQIIREDFLNDYCDGYIVVGEEETCLARYYEKFMDSIKNFEIFDSDIWVCSFPKSGTTWIQEMVWLIANNLDFEGAKISLLDRFPFLETCTLYDFEILDNLLGEKSPEARRDSIEHTRRQKAPRFIKTHLPFSQLPVQIQNGTKSPKMIYLVRNPKDVCVSYCHHGKVIQGWRANLENFSKAFMSNKIIFGPYWKHIFGYWERRDSPNLLIIAYEDMKRDLPSVIKKVATYLDRVLTDEQIERLCKHLSLESMKSNKAVNHEHFVNLRKRKNLVYEDGTFIRSGIVGKYKEEMSADIIKKFDLWIKKNIAGTSFGQQYDYNS